MRATVPFIVAVLLFLPAAASAHHGVASLGVAGLEGPGAPIETSSSATLPQGSFLGYVKLDLASFETYTPARDDEGERNAFWIYGLGYGLKPYLSLYVFAPWSAKKLEDNSFTTAGFADPSVTAVLGFKHDGGFRLVPAGESLDDLEDWHFTLVGGMSLPLGDAEIADAAGAIDPGMSLGFGAPSYNLGLTATRQLGGRLTGVVDGSWITFREHEYDDGTRLRFGDEWRLNAAASLRALTRGGRGLRLDVNLEGNYLALGRDELAGVGEEATGGRMLYLVPGARLYLGRTSLGVGVKFPVWTDLNEDELQQGAEGKERHRLITTFSTLF